MRDMRHLIRKLSSQAGFIKSSDMALNPGEKDYGNREGLRWHRFTPGQFRGETSLPSAASQTIENMMQGFKEQFGQYRMNPQTQSVITKFRGMIFVIYAHDSITAPHVMESLPPELKETAEFVKDKHVRMIPSGTEKSIGTPFWISHNAHAYDDLFPGQIEDTGKKSPESIVPIRSTGQRGKADQLGIPWGNMTISPTSNGFGLFLETGDGMEPVLRGQAPSNMEKFFIDNLRMGSSVVSMPEGPQGRIEPARRINLRKSNLDDQNLVEEQQRRLEIYNEAVANQTAYKLNLDSEGGIYAKNTTTGDEQYLSRNQLESIVRTEQIGKPFLVRPAKGQPIASIREGQWQMTDELRNHLETTDSPIGFTALSALRDHADEAHTDRYGTSMHAPYEGFKIIMIGPVFSDPSNLGEGKTTSPAGFATHLTSPGQELAEGERVEVDRNVQWTVLANEIRPNMQDKMNPWTRVQGKSDRSMTFDNVQDAVKYVMANYVDSNTPGNSAVLSAAAESLAQAQSALEEASQMPAGQMATQKKQLTVDQPVAPLSVPQPEPPIQGLSPQQVIPPQQVMPPGRTASLRTMLRRIKR